MSQSECKCPSCNKRKLLPWQNICDYCMATLAQEDRYSYLEEIADRTEARDER